LSYLFTHLSIFSNANSLKGSIQHIVMLQKAKLLLKTSRPVLWLWFAFPFIAGAVIGGAGMSNPWIWAQFIALGPLYGLVVYGINDVYDYETDRLNERKGSAHGEILEPETHSFVLKSCATASALLLLIASLTGSIVTLAGMAGLLLFAVAYSVPPIRLKDRAPLDSISNGIAYILLPGVMGHALGSPVTTLPPEAFWLAFATMGLHSATTIMDYESDRKAGINTFSVRFGPEGAAGFAIAALGATLLFSPINSFTARFILLQLLAGVVVMALDIRGYRELAPGTRDRLILLVYGEGVLLGTLYLLRFPAGLI
ncbi:MAG: UbiA family prenyltransferase, partial [Candidatus Nanohaloarchaea archaeon]